MSLKVISLMNFLRFYIELFIIFRIYEFVNKWNDICTKFKIFTQKIMKLTNFIGGSIVNGLTKLKKIIKRLK